MGRVGQQLHVEAVGDFEGGAEVSGDVVLRCNEHAHADGVEGLRHGGCDVFID